MRLIFDFGISISDFIKNQYDDFKSEIEHPKSEIKN